MIECTKGGLAANEPAAGLWLKKEPEDPNGPSTSAKPEA